MDYVHIDNLFFKGKHGVFDHERRVEQEFLVSLRLGVDTAPSGTSDQLADTIDYQHVKDAVAEIIAGTSRYLIEKLAEDIAAKLLEDKRILSAEITIKKTAVWDNGVPGVTITRNGR
jgi:7,8-dihydroneopterin aldolase/epimerase/oxygenase